MAQNPTDIYNQLLAIKNLNTNLSGLTSSSDYAKWSNVLKTVSTELSIFEQYLDSFVDDIEYQKTTSQIYTGEWWNDKMINFYQYSTNPDYGIVQINDQFQIYYNSADTQYNIIEFCATKQTPNNKQVTIKVAKNDGNDNPEVLSTPELSSAASFVDRIKGAGQLITVVSFPADLIKLNVNIYFDGQYIETNVKDNIKNSIKNYFKNLEFDGDVKLIKIVDSIQQVQGVKDVEVISSSGLPDGGIYETFSRVYITKSGYAQLNETDSLFNMIIE